MFENLQNLKSEAIAQITQAESVNDLEEIRIAYLGRNGKLTKLIKELTSLEIKDRKQTGLLINDVKKTIETALNTQKQQFCDTPKTWFDPTIPGSKLQTGSLHLVTQAIEEISNVFESIGFVRSRYPEVEWDWYSFGSLNFDPLHPARDDWETFFIEAKDHPKFGRMLLTPHTSSGQVREMQAIKTPPIRMINIAKCYRRQSDVSHVPVFHQFEGLVVDKDISIAHLRGTLDYFARSFFGPSRKTRIRPYNFPFTEPSFEVDISCDICKGTGLIKGHKCKLCKEGWLEIGGSGMVHPNVLKAGGIDPTVYTGFAFGWGVERVYMMKSGIQIPDVRLIYGTDLQFLRQF
ncbi:phenylalanine--tRNA ligase subunit alpha [Candidatus Woesebacteria bacterium]|nr:MAG: phenylalanine--tRNA ligase subunit alpha [Candidatus Woesebacteria bacterium]